MAYKIRETALALQDLDNILSYLVRTLENPIAAANFINAVESFYDDVERMPRMFGLCHDPRLRALGYRKAVIKNYVCVYKVDETENTVYILRFSMAGKTMKN